MGKQSQYEQGYRDGLARTAKVVKEEGLEGLERELKFRRITNLEPPINVKELDKLSVSIKNVVYQTLQLAFLSVLHDEFGFGETRCKRVICGIDKLAIYLEHGWIYWFDLIDDIKSRMQIDLAVDKESEERLAAYYRHPAPEDVYNETDYVDDQAWKDILRDLGFREQAPDKKSKDKNTWILDENGKPLIGYGSKYEQIQAYDTLYGYLLAKDHYDL